MFLLQQLQYINKVQILILSAEPNKYEELFWWKHNKDIEYFKQVVPNTHAYALWPLARCSHMAAWYSENINVRVNALNSSELNKCINPFRGQSISIFLWVQDLVRLKKLLVCAKTKIGGGRTKKYCALFVLAGETQAPASCSLTCTPNRDRPTLECCKWLNVLSTVVK